MKLNSRNLIILYIVVVATAIKLVEWLGPAFLPLSSFFLIGFVLSTRDRLHDFWEHKNLRRNMLCLIFAGGAVAFALGARQIAIASSVAFVLSMSANALSYHLLSGRVNPAQRDNISNTLAAGVDAFCFPLFAFGWPPLWLVMLGAFIGQICGGAMWGALMRKRTQ